MTFPRRLIKLFLIIPFLCIIMLIMYFTNYQPKTNIFLAWQEEKVPHLTLKAVPRYPEGVRLYIETENFTMSEVMTKNEARMAHGHVHLYINNELYGMITDDSVDISLEDLDQKENEILVTLQAADHRFITVDGQPVFARKWIDGRGHEFQYRGKKTEDGLLPDMIQGSINKY